MGLKTSHFARPTAGAFSDVSGDEQSKIISHILPHVQGDDNAADSLAGFSQSLSFFCAPKYFDSERFTLMRQNVKKLFRSQSINLLYIHEP
jgi:hypothetical protein